MKNLNIEDEYKKFDGLKKDEILKISEWICHQPHLPKITEEQIILFHHACYYSVEMTKRTIDYYCTLRTHCPEFFSNLDPKSMALKRAMDTTKIVPIKNKKTPEGYRIIIAGLNDFNPSNFVFADCIKLYTMIFEHWLAEDGIQSGHFLVMDMTGCCLGHLPRLSPMIMKKFLTFLQEAVPIRLKGLHYINVVPFMDKILAIMKPFMKQELINMLHLHSNLEEFYKFVPKDILPEEYGGTNGKVADLQRETYQSIEADGKFFAEMEFSCQVNEKLRPGKPKDASDIFGAEGNFKKLDFD